MKTIFFFSLAVLLAASQDYQDISMSEDFQESGGLWNDSPSFLTPQNIDSSRVERDGGSFHGHSHNGGRQPRRGAQGGRQSQPPVSESEGRRGRQEGGLGLALGILNNPADVDGNYNFNFADSEHGMTREEFGSPGSVSGGYTFISPEGQEVSVEYVADEFGFHPSGSHIPVAPPMPPHVRRLLDHLAKVNGLPGL